MRTAMATKIAYMKTGKRSNGESVMEGRRMPVAAAKSTPAVTLMIGKTRTIL